MPSEPTRLHPATLLFALASAVRQHLIPAIVVLFWGSYHWGMAFGAIVAGIAVITYAVVRYISLRYRMTETELIITEGILRRNERHIPFERIHNIDTSRTVFHRLFGVSNVSIQTAGGVKCEAELKVLSLEAVEAMRRQVFFARRVEASIETGEQAAKPATSGLDQGLVVTRLGIKELVLSGIISNRSTIALVALIGFLYQLDVPVIEEGLGALVRRFAEWVPGVVEWGLGMTIVLFILTFLGVIVALRILSIAWAILTLYDFTLMRTADELRTRYGLLTQHTATIPRHRIQLVKVEATWIHRLFGRLAVRARTAGSSAFGETGGGQDWLLPISRRGDLPGLLQHTHPALDLDQVEWHQVSPRAVRRIGIRITGVLAIPALVIGSWLLSVSLVLGAIAMLSLLILVVLLAWLLARLQYQNMAYGTSDEALWFRRGWLTRTLMVVRFNKIQTVVLSESPFDRRHRHATVKIDTANAGAAGYPIAIPYLPSEIARNLHIQLATAAGQTSFQW